MKRTSAIGLGGLTLLIVCLPVLAGAASPPDAAPGQTSGAPDAPYVVKKGDTLWGISRDLLEDPLLWPRLWEKNKFISDPNKIFPGDQLGLPGKGLAPAPAPVAEAPTPEPAKPEAAATPEPPKEKEQEKAEAPAALPTPAQQPPAPVEPMAPPAPPVPPASQHAMVCSPMLVPDSEAVKVGVGELVKSLDDRVMLSMEDQAVVGLDASQPLNKGDRLAAIRVGRRVIQSTGASAGRILHVLGLLEVTDVKDRVVRAKVSYSCGPMSIGDRVIPFAPVLFPEDKTPEPARRSVNAAVLDAVRGEAVLGLQQIAFVDVGTDQGIGVGDIFALMRQNAAVVTSAGVRLPMPSDRLGDAVVIRVTARSATVLLTASSREVRIGDQAVLSYQIAP